MCTRYYIEKSPELQPYIEAAKQSPLKNRMVDILPGNHFRVEGEIRPTDMTAVIAPSAEGHRRVFPMVWGYHVAGLDRPVVNARVESARDRKTFAEDWRKHRCIIPASWFFEWQHIVKPDGKTVAGQKYVIQPRGYEVTWMAGLYRIECAQDLKYPVFTILTRAASEDMERIHNRMPVILPSSAIDDWICPDNDPDRIAKQALTDLVVEKADPE